MILYYVRALTGGPGSQNAYLKRDESGLPVFTWTAPTPLSLGKAEILRRDGLKLCGGTLQLEEA